MKAADCFPTGAHQPHGNVGLLLQPCDYGLDVGNVFRLLTEAPEARWILAIGWCNDHGNHQTSGGEHIPRTYEKVASPHVRLPLGEI